jgi:hypothetical protein
MIAEPEAEEPTGDAPMIAIIDSDPATPASGSSALRKRKVVTVIPSPEDTPEEQLRRAEALKAHKGSTLPFVASVEKLVGFLGMPLTAYVSGVNETRAVRQWLAGDRIPHPTTQSKLQLALHVAVILAQAGEAEVITPWFQGLNPALDDQSPADLIRVADNDVTTVGRRVLAAAREFADS